MADIITLSSEDEAELEEIPKKRIKPTTLSNQVDNQPQLDSCIVVLDDDDDDDGDYKETKIKSDPPPVKAKDAKPEEKASSEDANCENVECDTKNVAVEGETKKVSEAGTNSDNDNVKNSSPLGTPSDEHNETENAFFQFLDACMKALENSQHKTPVESKLPIIKKLYKKCMSLDTDLDELHNIIQTNTKKVKSHPRETVVYFSDVFQWLKSSYKDSTAVQTSLEQNRRIIKKLEKALTKIRTRIRELEQAEINFDDDENSTYIQMDRYMARASKIYEKLCKYREENPHHGRLLYCRLDFSSSNFCEINQALNKKYKNNMVFPNCYEVDKCIRKCVQKHNLKISEESLKCEIQYCFEELGKLLQRRRKKDLHTNHMGYLEDTTEPKLNEQDIQKMNANRAEADKNLDELMKKYTRLQEKGVDPEVSPESEDSNVVESGSECEQDENATENI